MPSTAAAGYRPCFVGLSILAGIGLDLMPDAFADAPAWAASFLGSPLAFATTLAVSLNLLLGLGVSKKARLVLQPGAAPDGVLRFFERWGGMWGARPDVIRRAGPAAVELCEEVWSRDGPTEIAIDIVFDEFRLTVDIGWTVDDRRRWLGTRPPRRTSPAAMRLPCPATGRRPITADALHIRTLSRWR